MKRIITVLLANIICIIGAFCQEHVAHAIANEINVTYYANQKVVDYVSEGVSIGLQRRKIPANLLRTSISNEYTVLVDTIPSSSIWPRDFIAYYHLEIGHNDHLLIFIVGDSEYDPANYQMGTNGIAYLKLWNETIPPSYELPNFNYSAVNLALGLAEVQAKTTLLLDISNSDDFVSNLEEVGFQGTVITSGRDDGLAFHSAYPYGRFMFNWLCAMNYTYNIHSNNVYQLSFTADPNNNRTITLEEAFNYANSFEGSINPYYSSTPLTWGKYMSFNDVARDVDLYIRHNSSDTGNEYLPPLFNPLFGNFTWNSPDVYLRNQQDGVTNHSHDTLDLSFPGKRAYLYVKIRNDNNLNYPASGLC